MLRCLGPWTRILKRVLVAVGRYAPTATSERDQIAAGPMRSRRSTAPQKRPDAYRDHLLSSAGSTRLGPSVRPARSLLICVPPSAVDGRPSWPEVLSNAFRARRHFIARGPSTRVCCCSGEVSSPCTRCLDRLADWLRVKAAGNVAAGRESERESYRGRWAGVSSMRVRIARP